MKYLYYMNSDCIQKYLNEQIDGAYEHWEIVIAGTRTCAHTVTCIRENWLPCLSDWHESFVHYNKHLHLFKEQGKH